MTPPIKPSPRFNAHMQLSASSVSSKGSQKTTHSKSSAAKSLKSSKSGSKATGVSAGKESWQAHKTRDEIRRHEDRLRLWLAQEQSHGRHTFPPPAPSVPQPGPTMHAATCRCPSCRSRIDVDMLVKVQENINLHLTPDRTAQKGSTFAQHYDALCLHEHIQNRVIYFHPLHPLYETYKP
mmetsp:Transcript_86359/g.126374  ORF Transcript_86359/g.126374 Transcript_86359/m.126374 type:complete len:180 (-) Transcript_86359:63-602(-)